LTANLIDDAKATVQKFEARLDAARSALAANEERRSSLAFAVETGDADARKTADALVIEAAKHAADVRSLEAAVAEGARRVSAAQDAQGREALREKAKAARAVLSRLADTGAALDAALKTATQAYAGLQADLRELAALGSPGPSAQLVAVNMQRALDAGMSNAGEARPIAPSMRRSFADLCVGWSRPGIAWADELLGAHKTAERAA
jgi:hypothetical protein